jgi:hypothetical protein
LCCVVYCSVMSWIVGYQCAVMCHCVSFCGGQFCIVNCVAL